MSFKFKITLAICALMFLSLSVFGIFSYIDTKKKQYCASRMQTKNGITCFDRLYRPMGCDKKSGVDSTARSFKEIDIMAISDIIDKLQESTKILGAMDAYVGLEDGTMTLGSKSKLPEG